VRFQVWRDDIISHRLKVTLIRILTAEGSKYRNLVKRERERETW
jgi:hypothetical protein